MVLYLQIGLILSLLWLWIVYVEKDVTILNCMECVLIVFLYPLVLFILFLVLIEEIFKKVFNPKNLEVVVLRNKNDSNSKTKV